MDKYDLPDKLIETHIDELRERCAAAADLDFATGSVLWTEYFESHYAFFSTMLASKGAPFFRSRFMEFLVDEFQDEVSSLSYFPVLFAYCKFMASTLSRFSEPSTGALM